MVEETFSRWKGDSASKRGQFLRWGIGELEGEGDLEAGRHAGFSEARGRQLRRRSDGHRGGADREPRWSTPRRGPQRHQGHQRGHAGVPLPGAETVTVYRTWRDDQASYYQLDDQYEGEEYEFDHLPAYSWSLDPNAYGSGDGVVTQAEIPIEWVVLSDRADNAGNHVGEDEVVFRAKDLTVEVTKGGNRERETLAEYGVLRPRLLRELAHDVEYLIDDGQLEMAQGYISTLDQVGTTRRP